MINTVSELRQSLKGVKGDKQIHVRLKVDDKRSTHYKIMGVTFDPDFKEYVINIGFQ